MSKLRVDLSVLRVLPSEIWMTTMGGDIIKLEHDNAEELAKWLEGKSVQEPDADTMEFLIHNKILSEDPTYDFAHVLFIDELIEDPDPSIIYLILFKELDMERMNECDQWAHDKKVAWMPWGIMELGRIGFGPLVIPFETPCIKCLELRRTASSSKSEIDMRFYGKEIEYNILDEIEKTFLYSLLKLRMKNLVTFVRSTVGKIFTSDRAGHQIVENSYLWIPKCPRCYPRYAIATESWQKVSKVGVVSKVE